MTHDVSQTDAKMELATEISQTIFPLKQNNSLSHR
jgi:hypothetical protein